MTTLTLTLTLTTTYTSPITHHPGTYDYVLEKYEAVPKHISIIFLGMFRDLIDGASDEGSPQVGRSCDIVFSFNGQRAVPVGRSCYIVFTFIFSVLVATHIYTGHLHVFAAAGPDT